MRFSGYYTNKGPESSTAIYENVYMNVASLNLK